MTPQRGVSILGGDIDFVLNGKEIVEQIIQGFAKLSDTRFFDHRCLDELFGTGVEDFGEFVKLVESFVAADFVGLGQDDEYGQFALHAPVEHHHVVFRWGSADIEEQQKPQELFAFRQIVVHHRVPLTLDGFGNIRIAVARKIDEIGLFVDGKEVDELRTARRLADSGQVFLFAEHVQKRGFTDV